MNQREKILAIAVFGLLVAVAGQSGISRYRSGLDLRSKKIINLKGDIGEQELIEAAGNMAVKQLGQYRSRSLSSDPETARAQYKSWLESLIGQSKLDNWSVDFIGNQGSNKLFQVYTFHVQGVGDIEQVSEVIRDFHAANYLHRTKKLVLVPRGDNGDLLLNLDVEAIALSDASEEARSPTDPDQRLGDRADDLITSIINRNMFAPPNRAPEYRGSATLTVYLDKDFSKKLDFKDPDDDAVDYDITSDLPPGLSFDRGEIIGRAKEKGTFTVMVKAKDSGLPVREVEQELKLTVTDPPPEPEEPAGPPKFDESRQAVLTGLVQSRGQWTAWINVRTKNQLLKLKSGDDFEVGSVSGKILEVTDRFAVFESDGERFTLQHDTSLADAKSTAL